jgi:hypothetical protein
MLRRYRNALFEGVAKAGLSNDDFSGTESVVNGRAVFVVQYRDTALRFFVRGASNSPDIFEHSYTRFAPGYPTPPQTEYAPKSGWATFASVLEEFSRWLARDGRNAAEEELLPDLWARASSGVMSQGAFAGHETTDFSPEERKQIKLAVETFRHLLIAAFKPTRQQLDLVDGQLSYLKDAVDRLNRFDWRGVAISTLLSISIALSFDTERGRQLYGLFQQAFSAIQHALK